jgi:hypothetical protein
MSTHNEETQGVREADQQPTGDQQRLRSVDGGTGENTPLFSDEELRGYRERWEAVQTRFVDEPKGSVKEADKLVTTLIQRLTESFSEERSRLEARLDQSEDSSTEDLRLAIQRYRSFFNRLLAA